MNLTLNQQNSKKQGAMGLNVAMLYYSSLGWDCFICPSDSSEIDLIILKDHTLKKVQVKTTRFSSNKTSFSVQLNSCGGTRAKGKIKNISEVDFDLLFIICESGDVFEFTKEEIGKRGKLVLPRPEDLSSYKGRMWESDFPPLSDLKAVRKKYWLEKISPSWEKKRTDAMERKRMVSKKEKKNRKKFDPSKEELEKILEQNFYNLEAVGKIYGVSGNAVRKRAKSFGMIVNTRAYRKERGINIYK